MRAALYARYSSDKQSDTSSADQLRVCRARAEREEWTITGEWSDDAVSGATPVAHRRGASGAIAAGLKGEWDVLVVEGLDRISRDAAELELTIRRLEHRKLRIIGVSDGYDSAQRNRTLMRGMRGLMAQQYLEDLADRTHRGLSSQVSRGYHAGGLSYGYRTVQDACGHKLEVHPEQALIVVEIYRRYADGQSCQRIAADLNARGIKGPRGTWSVSALYGSPAKGTGVLNNELYRGAYTWNRTQWIKDPDTGVRQRFDRPPAEWQTEERPELRIVPDDLWQGVRERMGTVRRNQRSGGPKPTTLFGGLLICGKCGGSMIAVNAHRYGCAARKDRGRAVCDGLLIPREATDRLIVGTLKSDLLAPAALVHLQSEVKRLLASKSSIDPNPRIAELDREIARLVDAIAAVGISPALSARLQSAELERARLRAQCKPNEMPTKVDNLIGRYMKLVDELEQTLRADIARARTILAELVGRVAIRETEDGIYAVIDHPAANIALAAGDPYLTMVAGAGFEPTTFGL